MIHIRTLVTRARSAVQARSEWRRVALALTASVLIGGLTACPKADKTTAPQQATLTVTSAAGAGGGTVSGSGISCQMAGVLSSGTCILSFAQNSDVILAANPASGSVFAGWGGSCSGTSTCLFKMASGATVTANFALFTLPLTVVSGGGTGNGTVTGNGGVNCTITAAAQSGTCSSSYVPSTSVTLTATAATGGHVFAGWGDACTGTSATCTTTMSQGRNATASFRTPTSLTVASGAGDGNGTVTGAGINCSITTTTQSGTCSASFADTSTVVLTAAPATGGFTFNGWGGACSGTALTCSVAMNLVRAVTARFNAPVVRFPLTVASGGGVGNGTVTASIADGNISCTITGANATGTCSSSVAQNTVVTLTAAPAAGGYTFLGWGGSCSGTATTCVVTLSQARSVTASFGPPPVLFLLTVGSGGGTGNGTVTATIADGNINCTITAASTSGTCTSNVTQNTSVTLTATAAVGGHAFVGWGGACAGTSAACVITMSQARSVTASFSAPASSYSLTIMSGGSNGTGSVTGSGLNCNVSAASQSGACFGTFASGTVVTLTAAATGGVSTFAGWGGACTGTSTTCVVTLSQARTVTASFVLPVTYALSVLSGGGTGNGTISASGLNCSIIGASSTGTCLNSYNDGTVVTLMATPSPGGHVFSLWGGVCAGSATTCNVTMSQARSVTASFTAPAALTITNGNGNGVGTVSGGGIACTAQLSGASPVTNGTCTLTYAVGTSVTLTAAPNTGGYTFLGWGGACSGTGTCVLTLSGNVSVTAKFNAPALTDVQTQVFGVYCASCHASVVMTTATNSFNNTVNVNSIATLNGSWSLANVYTKRVLPYSATNSYMIYQMQKTAGAYPMPTNAGTTVPTNLVDLVKNWINGGARQTQP